MLLEYEKDILQETKDKSFILIASSGIELNSVLKLSIMMYCNKYSLVFLINFDDTLINISSEYYRTIKDADKAYRRKAYLKGGVFVCSSRILLTDFLESNVPVNKISCMLIKDADKIRENSINAFILYVYKQNNKDGLVKAFSTNCIPFAHGVNSLEKYVNILRTNTLILYPRFHDKIQKSFTNNITYTEHKIKCTDNMVELQMILIEILKEILHINKIDVEYELILLSNRYVNKQVKDVNDIKYLIDLLYSCNTLKFYIECKKLINEQIDLGKNSTWLSSRYTSILIDKIESITSECIDIHSDIHIKKVQKYIPIDNKVRLSIPDNNSLQPVNSTEAEMLDDDTSMQHLLNKRYKLEENKSQTFNCHNKKYTRLLDVVSSSDDREVYVIVNSDTTQIDILQHLQDSCKDVKVVTKKTFLATDIVQDHTDTNRIETISEFVNDNNPGIIYATNPEMPQNIDEVQCKPLLIIFYDVDIALIRKCEYIGMKANIKIEAFYYKDSLEEQKYLNSIRREKMYFEQLIEKRGKLPVLLDLEHDMIENDSSEEEHSNYVVVVDSRELRAELPFYLYKAKNTVEISTLTIGDYLLNEITCVERKNINDLISSIKSGRLYSQARMLSYNYKNPYLLLEFEARPCMSDFYNHSVDTFRNSLISKFCLFLITFPNVKVIWSESSTFSTKMLRCLQKKKCDIRDEEPYTLDPVLQEILLSIPGINQFNISKIVKSFKNIKELSESSRSTLYKIIGEDAGCLVYNFLHSNFT